MSDTCIGVDIGYGRVKVHNSDVSHNFPSAVSSYTDERTFEGRTQVHPYLVRGIPYLVGEEAIIHSSSLKDTRTDDYICSPGWFALLSNALYIADFHPERPGATVVIGIPPGYATLDRYDAIEKTIRLTQVGIQQSERSFTFSSTRVLVIPQGAGIFYCYADINPEAWKQDVAVIDLGHQTLDMIYMSNGAYVERTKLTRDLGVSRELERLAQLGRAMATPRRFRYEDLAAYVDDKSLFDVESAHYVAGAQGILKTFTTNLVSMIDAFLRSLPRAPHACLIAGGGVKFLDIEIMNSTDLLLAPEPELANAIGYWLYGRWDNESEV
jgi:hypothetical protein